MHNVQLFNNDFYSLLLLLYLLHAAEGIIAIDYDVNNHFMVCTKVQCYAMWSSGQRFSSICAHYGVAFPSSGQPNTAHSHPCPLLFGILCSLILSHCASTQFSYPLCLQAQSSLRRHAFYCFRARIH